jgi:hypothetical protein
MTIKDKKLKKNMVDTNMQLLDTFSKTVAILRDNHLNEAYNRIELQLIRYHETLADCDFTLFRSLCYVFEDKLASLIKDKTEMAKMMMNPEMLAQMGFSGNGKEAPSTEERAKIGFHNR